MQSRQSMKKIYVETDKVKGILKEVSHIYNVMLRKYIKIELIRLFNYSKIKNIF